MLTTRPPAVAGTFYPGSAHALREAVQGFLAEVREPGPPPKALVAPHAGYVYSGPIAAHAYATLRAVRHTITRVVLLGPAHRVLVQGLATSSAEAWATPLGEVPLDRPMIERLEALPQVVRFDRAHAMEHSLEVHLPFLQLVLDRFALVPLCVGNATKEEVAGVLEAAWGGPETLVVVSSDLTHYLDYKTAQRIDRGTAAAIERLDAAAIGEDQACGRVPLRGLLEVASRHGLAARTLDLRSSGDTAGMRDEVVGYGAWAFA